MNIEKPTEFLRNISVIVGIIIGGWWGLEEIFATKLEQARHEVVSVEREIDTGEKLRDHYQYIQDTGRPLNAEEARRARINNDKLNRLYIDLEDAQDRVKTLED